MGRVSYEPRVSMCLPKESVGRCITFCCSVSPDERRLGPFPPPSRYHRPHRNVSASSQWLGQRYGLRRPWQVIKKPTINGRCPCVVCLGDIALLKIPWCNFVSSHSHQSEGKFSPVQAASRMQHYIRSTTSVTMIISPPTSYLHNVTHLSAPSFFLGSQAKAVFRTFLTSS